jgi:hypothetical protein
MLGKGTKGKRWLYAKRDMYTVSARRPRLLLIAYAAAALPNSTV